MQEVDKVKTAHLSGEHLHGISLCSWQWQWSVGFARHTLGPTVLLLQELQKLVLQVLDKEKAANLSDGLLHGIRLMAVALHHSRPDIAGVW